MKMYRPHRLYPRNSKPKEPSLYRSLCVSILCMFLSTVMLVGTTMAWFSDSLQTGVYTITSADFSTTVYYCTDLAGESGTNNWQRLNPGNTTMFGGGSLSGSSSYQTAYLKIVNASDIGLKYTLSITGETTGEGSSTLPLSLAYKLVDNETGLNAALTSSDEGSNSENTGTGTTISFTVPQTTTKFVALKLSLNATPPESTDQKQPAKQYEFSLRLEIMQDQEGAGVTKSNSSTSSTSVDMTITGSTPSTPALTVSKSNAAISGDKVLQPPSGENSSDTNNTETLTPETLPPKSPADPPAEAASSDGPTESDTTSNVITSPSNGENLS